MKLATGTTVILNGQLVDGTGTPPIPDARPRHQRRPHRLRRPRRPDARRCRPTRAASTPAAAPSCRAWSRPTSTRPTSTSPPWKTSTSSIRSSTSRCWRRPTRRLALECGYTAARSGGSLFNIDVWLKKAIENDLIPGPRLAASGREICGVGGLMDWNPDFRKIGMEGLVLLVNGPDEARAAVRKLVKDGVEWVKTYPTGDAAAPDTNDHHTLCMTFEEMHAVVATAHNHGLKVTGHCRATAGHQERPAGRLRHARARHVHGRRGARPAAGARHAGGAGAVLRAGQHRARPGVRHVAARDRRPQGDAGRRRRERPHDPEGRRPARHGRRLRLRLEPARRLRQGADLLRQVRRLHAAGDDHAAPRRPAPRSWAAATSSARWSPASWPTCWSSTATCCATSASWRIGRDSWR